MFNKILVCSDGSDHALAATRAAASLANKYGSEVVVVTVFDPSTVHPPFMGVVGGSLASAIDEGRYASEVQSNVERTTCTLLDERGVRYSVRRELGHPVDRLVAAICDEHADLVVIGRRGLSMFQSLRLGSVSDGVIHHVHCPVLVVQ